ncbi:MAG TPA: hypothetical protein DFR83_16595, partial [Deltaproteobacteria bacterium]|nr:hypothetical protein [Deltaproteobacteria bacterium]
MVPVSSRPSVLWLASALVAYASALVACAGPAEKAPVASEATDSASPLAPWSPLTAIASCSPTAANTCDLPTVAAGTWTAYRKDASFPDAIYNEYTDSPSDGGRVHVLATAAASGTLTTVTIDGIDIHTIDTPTAEEPPPLDWAHVWPIEVVAGQPIWVSFHSRSSRWDRAHTARLVVETNSGTAVDTDFTVAESPLQLTSVTTAQGGATRVLFLRNDGTAPLTLDRILLDGIDATDAACIATPTLEPGAVARVTVPLCTAASPGSLWSAIVTTTEGMAAVAGGRMIPESFPIEAWNNTTECPWPGGNDANAEAMSAMGIDTHYLHGGVCNDDACNCDEQTLIETIYGASDSLRTLVTRGVARDLPDTLSTTGIAAFSTGDESDGELFEEDPESPDFGAPKPAIGARESRILWERFPEVPTFNGGMTNGHIGTFAGMADI